MPNENTGAPETQADSGTQPPAGNPAAQAANGTEQQPESISLDEAKKLRAENHSLRERAKALEAEKTAAETAKLPEQERLQRRLVELERAEAEHERERQDWRLRDAVTTTALRLGYRDPADAFALIDRAALEYDEAGNPKNVDKLLTDLATAKPWYTGNARGGSFDGGPRGKPTGGESFDDQLRRAAGRL
jgi:hypothetical protein